MKSKNGISLIVLVITIIVMIVLAGAIILSLNNAGIIEKANEAVKSTDEATVKELAQMAWAEAYADEVRDVKELQDRVDEALEKNGVDTSEYVVTATLQGVNIALASQKPWVQNGLTLTRGEDKLTVGQTINYTATGTDYKGQWKVLGADDKGNLLIMSDTDVATEFSLYTEATTLATVQSAWLSGGVNKLNSECTKYGKGRYAIGARSITVEDVNKVTGYNPENVDGKGTSYASTSIHKYGNEVTYTYNGTTKPSYKGINEVTSDLAYDHTNGFYWYDEDGLKSVTSEKLKDEANKGKEIAKITSSYYYYKGTSKLSAESDAYKMIFGTSNSYNYYWFASPCILANANSIGFGMRCIDEGDIYYYSLWDAAGGTYTPARGVRAVVTLESSIPMASLTK